jgi:hypothetical protein
MAAHTLRSSSNPSRPLTVNAASDPIFIGAGDIGKCPQNRQGKYMPRGTKAEATAELVASLLPADPRMGVVFVAGDNAYMEGTAKQYAECYDPTWGRFKDRTRPVPGNHEFIRDGRPKAAWYARDYFDYFGEDKAGKRFEGYYSYDLGEWHIIALNSELRDTPKFKAMTKQKKWLREDLKNNRRRCTLAYWHRPIFSSGEHGTKQTPTQGVERTMLSVWRILDAMGVDVVINGHEHNYERFNAQDADRNADPNGIVEFVVGTGGVELRDKEIPPHKRQNSAAFDKFTWGVLKLTLHPTSYDFEFIPVASRKRGPLFRDRSTSPVPCVE